MATTNFIWFLIGPGSIPIRLIFDFLKAIFETPVSRALFCGKKLFLSLIVFEISQWIVSPKRLNLEKIFA